MKGANLIDPKRAMLIVDDDSLFCDSLKYILDDDRTQVSTAVSLSEARAICSEQAFDVVLLDNQLPDGNGSELIPEILGNNDHAKIILVTAFPAFEHAVQAIKNGAYDYITKPVDLDELVASAERAFQAARLEAIEQVARYQNDRQRREAVLVGFQGQHSRIRDLIERAASSDANVLITGDTGTGKNVVAKLIHHRGRSLASSLIKVNCSALPASLIESELFGTENGSIAGSVAARKGLFELAEGGTLFLDEISQIPDPVQAKLVSALEDRQVKRIGGKRFRSTNVRVIASTELDPETAVENGLIRRDPFYQLNVVRIHLPLLRDRIEDVPLLCRHFIDDFAPNRSVQIPESEIRRLKEYDFPGNVRELRNLIERSLLLHEGAFIYPSQLLDPTGVGSGSADSSKLDDELSIGRAINESLPLTELERRYIVATYDSHGRNMARASNALGISFSTMKRKLQSFGVR